MDISDYMGGTDGGDPLGLGDYMDEMMGAIYEDAIGAVATAPVDVLSMVRDPKKLLAAVNAAKQARVKALAVKKTAPKNSPKLRIAALAARQHAVNAATLATLASMHAHARADARMRANYAFGITLTAAGGGATTTDIVSLRSPIGDQPWRVLSWQGTLSELQYFVVSKFVPADVDVVSYGQAGVSYAATSPVNGFMPFMWMVENFGAPSTPTWQLAPWQRPGYAFGGSAVVQLQLTNIDAGGAHTAHLLGLGQCSPCNAQHTYGRFNVTRMAPGWSGVHQRAFF